MCLQTLANFSVEKKVGYKVGHIEGSNFVTGDRECVYPLGEWVEDKNLIFLRSISFSESYPAGFHIFLSLEGARDWCRPISYRGEIIVQVEFDNIVATGCQRDDMCVVVARKMKIGKVVM